MKKTSLGSRLLFHKINPFNTVSSTATLSNFIKALKLFESFASTQDKQDMIDSFEKAIAEKQAKNLNNVRPPVVNEKKNQMMTKRNEA